MFIKSRNCFEKKTKCSKTKQVVLEQIKMFYKKYYINIGSSFKDLIEKNITVQLELNLNNWFVM